MVHRRSSKRSELGTGAEQDPRSGSAGADNPGASAQEEASQSAAFRARVLDSLYDGVYFVDRDRKITYWNRGAERLTGFTAEEVVGSHCFDDILAHVDDAGCELCTHRCPIMSAMEEDHDCEHQIYLRHKQGHRVPVSVRAAPLRDEKGQVIGAVEIFSDSSGLKTFERRIGELESIAFRDPLTGLPNRRYTSLKIQQALQEVEQFGRAFGLVFLDIDRFKEVNDDSGHAAGDAILRMVADTLSHNLRPSDVVGRWGGDEFVAIVADVTPSSLRAAAERWRKLIASSSTCPSGARIRATVSIGATLFTIQDKPDEAIDRADRLMYRSKSRRNHTTLG